jgi:geranylgeranylglycerol-phosphate geranylgeranyltransferase
MVIMKKLLLMIRPFHIVHQFSIIALAISVRGQLYTTPLVDILLVWLMQFLIMPLTLLINDYLHREEDKKMKLKHRLFVDQNIDQRLVIAIVVSLFFIIALIALSRSIYTLLAMLLIFIVASLYGYFKYKKMTTATYLFRGFSGGALYLFIASYFQLIAIDLLIALLILLLDFTAHISGDLRDLEKDGIANMKTYPVLYGEKVTEYIIVVMQVISISYLLIIFYGLIDTFDAILFIGISSMSFIFYYFFKSRYSIIVPWSNQMIDRYRYWYHACFHGSKVIVIFLLAFRIADSDITVLNRIGLVILSFMIWLVSYYVYLFIDNRLPNISLWNLILDEQRLSIEMKEIFTIILADDLKFNYHMDSMRNQIRGDQSKKDETLEQSPKFRSIQLVDQLIGQREEIQNQMIKNQSIESIKDNQLVEQINNTLKSIIELLSNKIH